MKAWVIALLGLLLISSVKGGDISPPTIIPAPLKMTLGKGVFKVTENTRVFSDKGSQATANYLAERLRIVTGFPIQLAKGKFSSDDILITMRDANGSLGEEGYTLVVVSNGVVIRATTASGSFQGVQSLLQLFPPQAFAKTKVEGVAWELPVVQIEDQPRFKWRGMMLDVGRHFIPKDDVKRMIDAMALHKLNKFHWHLTEDQGWRIEIKKYPKLTEVGAWRASSPPYGDRNANDGQRHGGFYTQEEVREVVAYAAARHITIIPEIEMPGHAAAAIASYPEFGNTDVPGFSPRVVMRWGVQPYTFAPREETFRFLEDVLTEVCALFPSKYIHIGGDEAPKTQWKQSAFAQEVMKREGLKTEEELQSWFIRRIGKFLESKNRRLIGWDEIQEGGLPKTATMMVWRDAKWAKHALALGNDVVMATTSHTYLDYYQAKPETELARGNEFEAIGGFLPLEKVYSYNPAFVAENSAQEKQILGTQGQIWGEYVKDVNKAQYMAFPRVSALAEVAWTPQANRNYQDFLRRLPTHLQRLDQMGVKYFKPEPAE